MSRLDNVIKDIENVNKECHAWIYEPNGTIKDDVICGDVLDLLYELKNYEIETTEKSIDWIVERANRHWNTYMAIMVHRYGDVRANYTDRFLVRFDDETEWFELESRMQYKTICDGKYCCDIDIMAECYNVWDWDNNTSIGEFYEIEVEDLLEAIEEKNNQKFSKTSYK